MTFKETMADAYFKIYFPWPEDTAQKFESMEEHYQRWEAIRKAERAASVAGAHVFLVNIARRRLESMTQELGWITETLKTLMRRLDREEAQQ